MGKKAAFIIGAVFLVFCVIGIANASLIDQGSGVLFDEEAAQYWVQDLSKFRNLTYSDQHAAIEAYTVTINDGTVLSDWHVASRTDVDYLTSAVGGVSQLQTYFLESGRLSFPNLTRTHWTGRIVGETNWGMTRTMYSVRSVNNYLDEGYIGIEVGAWAVMNASIPDAGGSPVPEPATILLFGLGLLGVAGVNRKKTI